MILLLLLFAIDSNPATGQDNALERGYREMYNLSFEDAHKNFTEWQQIHPDDPMGPVSDAAAYLFSEFDRLHILQSEFFVDDDRFRDRRRLMPDAKLKAQFERDLDRTRVLADAALKAHPSDGNALLASIMRYGLHADYLALIEKKNLASLTEVKQGRRIAEDLIARCKDCYDAYLAIGVENYLLSLKPAPVRWLLHIGGSQTDKENGLRALRVTADKGHYLEPYAKLLLAVAALRDNNRTQARLELASLASRFPRNHLYREELAKTR
jgi:hypothetical protein